MEIRCPRRLILNFWVILAISGCAAEGDRDQATPDATTDAPKSTVVAEKTRIWMQNLTGEPIRRFRFSYEDTNGSSDFTYATDVSKQETEIWSREGEAFVLKTMTVTFDDGAQSEFIVDHRCKPGEQVLLILDIAGRMKVQTKE